MIYRLTKLTKTIPLKSSTATAVGNAFVYYCLFCYFLPKAVLSDNASQFTACLFTELSPIIGANNFYTTTYYPNCNEQVDRFNHTILSELRHYLGNHLRECTYSRMHYLIHTIPRCIAPQSLLYFTWYFTGHYHIWYLRTKRNSRTGFPIRILTWPGWGGWEAWWIQRRRIWLNRRNSINVNYIRYFYYITSKWALDRTYKRGSNTNPRKIPSMSWHNWPRDHIWSRNWTTTPVSSTDRTINNNRSR